MFHYLTSCWGQLLNDLSVAVVSGVGHKESTGLFTKPTNNAKILGGVVQRKGSIKRIGDATGGAGIR
ncbi:uncharacterized protein METZ01_LOCUS126026 [marine metagenome]|uniref:Uncharacterized protein n=1 Tax=marine metagenome TaxID=408172 RepID=A0A381Y954_9ZZZZ